MSRLSSYLLGPPRLERGGEPVQIGRLKALALLVYLVVTRRRHSSDALAARFWPEYDQSSARAHPIRTSVSKSESSSPKHRRHAHLQSVYPCPNPSRAFRPIRRSSTSATNLHNPTELAIIDVSVGAADVPFAEQVISGVCVADLPKSPTQHGGGFQ